MKGRYDGAAAGRAGRALLILAMMTGWPGGVAAQGEPRDGGLTPPMRVQAPMPPKEAQLVVPAVVLAAPAGETPLGIRIQPGTPPPATSFVRIRGLPPTAALTEGHSIAPGSWAIPLAALDNLKVLVPAGLAGKREIIVALVTGDGQVVHETKVALVIAAAGLIAPEARRGEPAAPPPMPTAPAAAAVVTPSPSPPPAPAVVPQKPAEPAPPPPSPPPAIAPPAPKAATAPAPKPAPPAPSPEAIKRAQGYLARGLGHLKDSDIASARLFFQRAAEDGLADGALAMGGTFDPDELARLRAPSIKPDLAETKRWYERAAELGSGEALDRLKRLGAR